MFSKRALQPYRISRVLTLSLAVGAALMLTVLAAHITTPLVKDFNMGNLSQNEREVNIVVDPSDPDIVAGGANQRAGTNAGTSPPTAAARSPTVRSRTAL